MTTLEEIYKELVLLNQDYKGNRLWHCKKYGITAWCRNYKDVLAVFSSNNWSI